LPIRSLDGVVFFAGVTFVRNYPYGYSASSVTGVDTTTISTESRELPLAKIYENSSLDYSFFCTFDPRSNASLLRERIGHDHDHNHTSTSPGTHYGGLVPLLIAAAPFPGAKMNSLLFEVASVLVRLDHVSIVIVNANHCLV
jgi:hypothetical protein